MKKNDAKAIAAFRAAYKGRGNLMTNEVVGIWSARNGALAIELSKGRGIGQSTIYGVTVVHIEGAKPDFELSKCVFSMEEATEYMEAIDAG